MQIKVYQATMEAKNKFMNLDFTNRVCGGINKDDYHLVFDGVIPAVDFEEVFDICNSEERPAGYTGHSMSVSDIVVTDEGAFYCDSFNFKKIVF
jgi:hypothetical protein